MSLVQTQEVEELFGQSTQQVRKSLDSTGFSLVCLPQQFMFAKVHLGIRFLDNFRCCSLSAATAKCGLNWKGGSAWISHERPT